MAKPQNVKASARINKEWGVRLGLIAALFIAGGCWYLYDGLVTYPRQSEMYELVYQKTDEGTAIKHDDWKQRLEEAGYSSDIDPEDLKHKSGADIMTQLIIAGICFPIGLLALFWLGLNSVRPMFADDQAVHFGRKRLAFDQVDQIDKSRWDSKGIAVVHGRDGGKIVLDDWKFRGAADVLAEVERHVDTGDEVEPMADPAEEADPAAGEAETTAEQRDTA